MKTMSVNGVAYTVIKLLGHGKGGYSYLAERNGTQFVLKQIHHEPCAYYQFGNKIESEKLDYDRLLPTGIRMPKMLDIDLDQERILKEYISGATIAELVERDEMKEDYLYQVQHMADLVREHNLNIDYFPTNFVVSEGLLYYIDYECNEYQSQWDFENWGIQYWSKTPEFLAYLANK